MSTAFARSRVAVAGLFLTVSDIATSSSNAKSCSFDLHEHEYSGRPLPIECLQHHVDTVGSLFGRSFEQVARKSRTHKRDSLRINLMCSRATRRKCLLSLHVFHRLVVRQH